MSFIDLKNKFFLTLLHPIKILSTDVFWYKKKQITTNVVAGITAKMFSVLESYKINHTGTYVCHSDIPTDTTSKSGGKQLV